MEHAPLRPVPARPPGPVDPEDAARHVAASLPGLDAAAATALGLVALAGSSREEAAEATGLGEEALGETLARARKALRRSMVPLAGSGWCERAERLVSDRLDDALEPPGPARLQVHLRNCSRCVEHERRLVQATNAMVADLMPAPSPAPAPTAGPPSGPAAAPPLSVVERSAARTPAALPFGEPIRPAPARVPRSRPVVPAEPRPEGELVPAEPVASRRERTAVRPPTPLARPRPASAIAWKALLVLAVMLAVTAAAVVIAGALGASLT
ncbi:MAG TPA: zf-HC2 domain-containing protein [Thermoleophilaceae bacterium]|nr:zf-HC2 domain-containing protein [Thermoleophilaceae bacterium]